MNWKSIEQYDLPPDTDVLFRIKFARYNFPIYVGGWVDEHRDIITHESNYCSFGCLCNVATLHSQKIETIHYINPAEILL